MKRLFKSKLVLSLLTVILLGSVIAVALVSGTIRRTHAAAVLTPPFTQCPAVGADNSCAVLIVFNADGTTSIFGDGSQGPFDGVEDTLVGVQNNTSTTISNTTISGNGIFYLEGDGLCGGYSPEPSGCPFGSTGYEGPNTSFSIADPNKGTVNFTGGLTHGKSAYFSLEGTVSASSIKIPAITVSPMITLSPSTSTNVVGTNYTVTATVATSQPVVGTTVTFTVISGPDQSQTATGTTDVNGNATFTYTNNGTVGTDTIQGCFVDQSGSTQCAKATKDWIIIQTTLTYSGITTSDYNDPAALSAKLVDGSGNAISGATINFGLDSQKCNGTTDSNGIASCSITPNEQAGS